MKADAGEIIAVVNELEGASWLGRRGAKWPNHLYHFADVRNAASILLHGFIYSRARCRESALLVVDSADQEVIEQSTWAHRFVRLYFAPRTPTQYHMEGIRPSDTRRNGAHCPVPIFLIFDSRRLLVRDDCRFSDGNIAVTWHRIGFDATFFRDLPFQGIYHRGVITDRRSEIVYARNAEVLFEDQLDLEHLKEIVCRTGPERETLLNLLGRKAARTWKDRIRLERPDEGLFERRWYYVREINLVGQVVHVRMSGPCAIHPQHLDVLYPSGREPQRLRPRIVAPAQLSYELLRPSDEIRVRLQVMDALAYQGRLTTRALF